MLNAKHLTV